MKIAKFVFTFFVGIAIMAVQVGSVLAAPARQEGFITGTVTEVTCGTGSDPGAATFIVTVMGTDGASQTVRIDQETAAALGIIAPNTPCSEEALAGAIGLEVTIDPAVTVPDEEQEARHPVGLALSLFFDDITDYETIMEAHGNGTGFGVIAQALWLTVKMEGDSDVFLAILEAKKTGDYSAFALEDGSTFQNWGQFKKAALKGDKKGNLGVVMSDKGNNNGSSNGNGNGNGSGNGVGNGNGHGNGNGNGHGNGNGNGNGHGNGNGNK